MGSYCRATVYVAPTEDRKRLFRIHEKLNFVTFVSCLRMLLRRFGRVAAIVDRAL